MQVKQKVQAQVEQLTDILCDLCGNTCRDSMGINYEYATLKATWGYNSNKDCQHHEAHICEKCYDNLPLVKEGKVRRFEYTPGVIGGGLIPLVSEG